MKLGKHDEPEQRRESKVTAEPERRPAQEPKQQTVRDPWSEHCSRCGLLGCRKGHT